MEYTNLYLILIIIGITIFGYNKLQEKKVIESKEHFYIFGSLIKAMRSIADFFVTFPDLFMIMVDAMINFFLSFVDIILTLVSALEWIVNIPMWFIEFFFFIITLIADVILLIILWLNPITMIKGIVKMIFFMIKLILVFIFDMVKHIVRQVLEYFLDKFRDGLWGIPHGPDQHVDHIKWGDMERPIDEGSLGPHQHHHNHDLDIDNLNIYKPLRCYKGIGANGYLNIIAIIICPPLGVFMSFGLAGWLKIIICAGLSLFYYFPGLVYALLITTHLGLGIDIDTDDCGGVSGGFFTQGCEKRLTKDSCEDATIPYYKDKNQDKIRACKWEPNTSLGGGVCRSQHFRGRAYENLMSGDFNPNDEWQPSSFSKGEEGGYMRDWGDNDAQYTERKGTKITDYSETKNNRNN